jgi:hypothetical protein
MDGDYPEHAKLVAVREVSQAQGEFLVWLGEEKNYLLGKWTADEMVPVHADIQKLLAEFHGVDLNRLEAEKQAMLEELRHPKK